MTRRRSRSLWILFACLVAAPSWTANAASATTFRTFGGLHCVTCSAGPDISLGSGGNVQPLPSLVSLELEGPPSRREFFGATITSIPGTGLESLFELPSAQVPEPQLAALLLAALSMGLYRGGANPRRS